MSTSQAAAVHVVPFIARLVLCAAFVPAGYAKIFEHAEVSAEGRARLDAIGWSWTPPESGASGAEGADGGPISDVRTAAYTSGAQSAPAPATATEGSSSAPETTAAGPTTVLGVERLALAIDAAHLPAPRVTAWLVAITELLGGFLILIGLFSRLCALGLTAVMCGAIALTSLDALKAHPMLIGMPPELLQHFLLQAALLALALGVLLAGPGCLSVDQALFGKPAKVHPAPRSGGNGGA